MYLILIQFFELSLKYLFFELYLDVKKLQLILLGNIHENY